MPLQNNFSCRFFVFWPMFIRFSIFVDSTGQPHETAVRVGWLVGTAAINVLIWFLAVSVVTLCWFVSSFGTFGLYSFMFFTILRTLIQVSAFFFILTAAFTAATQTLFYTKIYPNNTDYYKRHVSG